MSYLPEQFIENRTPVSVKDFSAVGDGITDDTNNIQTAITNEEIIYLPAGSGVEVIGFASTAPSQTSPPLGCVVRWSDSDFAIRAMTPGGMRSAISPSYESDTNTALVDIGDAKEQIITTTNSTPGTIVALTGAIPDFSAARIYVRTTTVNISTGECAEFDMKALVKRVSGTLSQIGSTVINGISDSALNAVVANLVVNNTSKKIEVQVTGLTATTLRWHSSLRVETIIP